MNGLNVLAVNETDVINEVNERILELNAKYQNTKIMIDSQLVNKPEKIYDKESIEEILYDDEHTPVIKLNSVDELEHFLDKVEEFNSIEKEVDYNISENMPQFSTMSTEYNGDHTFSWNAATWWHYLTVSWEIFMDKNLRVEYTYKWIPGNKTEFVRGTGASSWISGVIVVRSWTQQGNATMNVLSRNRTNDHLKTSVTGTYVIGMTFEVLGTTIPIGLTNTETWVCNLYYD